jgi:putative hydrolase of the HAD superfamily
MKAVGGVIFDFYGTLAYTVVHPGTHAAVFARHGLSGAHPAWGDQWAVGPADGEEHAEHSVSRQAYRAWELARLRARARTCGVPEERIEPLVRDLDRVQERATAARYEEVAEVLDALRRRGLVLAVCSNWGWDLEDAIAGVGLGSAFDVTVSSARAGARKPHPLVYRVVLERCGLRAGQALFVGDSWGPDVEGPLSTGMRAVHLWREERAVRGAGVPPPLRGDVRRIADLRELLGLI